MSNIQDTEKFAYTYSAKEQEEVRRIREKYIIKEESKTDRLKKLDEQVNRRATASSLSCGIGGALVLGLGMCCTMAWSGIWFIPGIFLGILGMVMCAFAYPIYNKVLTREKNKVAEEILRLSEEILK